MSRQKGRNVSESVGSVKNVTPEQVILSRLHHLAYIEEIQSFFFKLIMMVLFLWILFGVIFGIAPMRNDDMSPRISAGDLLLYYRLNQKIRTDDVVVFEKEGKEYVGRIVGKGGESVEITEDSRVKVNGYFIDESDIFYSTPRYGDEIEYPLDLEEDEYFVLCDYRNGARDSRYFGPVSQGEIKGKVITVLRRSSL